MYSCSRAVPLEGIFLDALLAGELPRALLVDIHSKGRRGDLGLGEHQVRGGGGGGGLCFFCVKITFD